MASDIDIVITWVNNHDPNWLKEYNFYFEKVGENESSGRKRFEDLDSLHYIFRGIDSFLPWIRKIHFVTANQVPTWLNVDHPKLNLVSHKQIFPDMSYLPNFNSNAIEMCFSNIPDLSEKFIYFNDDTFVIKPVDASRFFNKNKPKDFLALKILHHDGIFSHGLHSTMKIINKELKDKNKFIFKNFFKIFNLKYGLLINIRNLILFPFTPFSLFKIYHHPQPLLKSTLIKVIKNHPDSIEKTRRNRFRGPTDIIQYVFRYMNLIEGNFSPYYPYDAILISVGEINKLENEIASLKNKKNVNFVCFNENLNFDSKCYDKFKILIREYLDLLLPDKSSYEK